MLARYTWASRQAYQFLLNHPEIQLPADFDQIFSLLNVSLSTTSQMAKIHNVTNDSILHALPTDEGLTSYDSTSGKYGVLYNDMKPNYRIRFTLAHELGHIVLRHFEEFGTSILTRNGEDKFLPLEQEANAFARNILVPIFLYDSTSTPNKYENFANYFDTSLEFIRIRAKMIFEDRRCISKEINDELCNRYKNFTYNFENTLQCKKCKSIITDVTASYCPVCCSPSKSITFKHNIRGIPKMTISTIEVDDEGRAKICPVCKNKHVANNFCSVCGEYILNRCSSSYDSECQGYLDNEPLPGYARYCSHCGSQSTFLLRGFLEAWDNGALPKTKDISEEDLPF